MSKYVCLIGILLFPFSFLSADFPRTKKLVLYCTGILYVYNTIYFPIEESYFEQ